MAIFQDVLDGENILASLKVYGSEPSVLSILLHNENKCLKLSKDECVAFATKLLNAAASLRNE